MKKGIIPVIASAVLILMFGWVYYSQHSNRVILGNKPVSYLKAIDMIYTCDIKGMAVVVNKVDNLLAWDPRIYYVATGSKENDFALLFILNMNLMKK